MIALLTGVLVGGAWLAALRFEGPGHDLRAGLREALAEAYGRTPDQVVDLDAVIDDDWDNMYVFGPLTPRDEIDRTIAPATLDDERDLVPSESSFVVLTRRREVVEAAVVGRDPIDISCATGGEHRALPRSAEPQVVRTVIAGTPQLAMREAGEEGEADARACLAELPR